MSRTFKANVFSAKSLRELQKELTEYRDSLQGKMQTFMERLLAEGIVVAEKYSEDVNGRYGTHKMGALVSFNKSVETSEGKIYGILVGTGKDVIGEWYVNDGSGNYSRTQAEINSLLAIEFGTAALALRPQDAFGVHGGKGTLARHGHENDKAWYIITGLDNKGKPEKFKLATAIEPTRPMYQAGLAMYEKVKEIGKEVFGS